MNLKFATAAALLAVLAQTSFGQGTVSTSSAAPTADILSSNNTGGTYSRIIDEDNSTNHARGQGFTLGDGAGTGYQITAITIHKNGSQTFANDTMTLRIYEGTQAQWDAGTGHSTAADGSNYYVDTTVTPLRTETFTVDGQISGGQYVTFQLASPLTANEDSEFGFFFTYDESAPSSPDYFQYNENGTEGRTSITTTNHGTSDSRGMRYFVQGMATGGGGGTDGLAIAANPPADAMVSQASSGSWTRSLHDGSTTAKTTRGNTFLMPDTGDQYPGYEVTGLTIRKDTAQSFGPGDTLQLWLFAWDPATDGNDESRWIQAGTNGTQDGNPLSGTGMPAMLVETYDLDGLTIADDAYITCDFSDTPLYLAENKTYGFLIGYIDGADANGAYFQFAQATSSPHAGGMQIRTQNDPSANSSYSPWDTTFFIRGRAIDAGMSGTDSDDDGLADVWEFLHFQGLGQTATDDPDGDHVNNGAEETAGTDPGKRDSDDDGLDDDVEIAGPTDPLDHDSDDDSLLDGVESGSGTYLSSDDTGTNPMLADTDGDGATDGIEIKRGFDPFDADHQPGELPNIVFIMIDDLDTREIGVYGQATLQTPRIDTMASQGMMFNNMYTASPVCHSCRSSLMTGQDSRRSQDRHNSSLNLHPTRVTIAEVLKEAGYTTACVGKWGMGTSGGTGAPWKQGFDFFCGYLSQTAAHRFFPKFLWKNDQKIYFDQALASAEGGTLYLPGAANLNNITRAWDDGFGNVCSHDVVVAEGLRFIEDNADKPFFLYCAWTPPHAHMYPAATLDALTDADGLLYDPLDLDQTLINDLYPGAPFGGTPETPDFNNHCYASMVSAADRDTGRIMDKLVELGIDDKTLVIFCSDNGEDEPTFLTAAHLKPGYSDFRGLKRDTYEGGIRSPFVAWWPGTIQPGTSSDVIGTFADMLPTFAEMTGLSTPSQITGRSLLPVLLGGSEDDLQARDYHYWCFTEGNRRWRAVRRGDWKIVRDRANDGSPPTYELFNLATDLYETTDLSATEPVILNQLIPLVEGTHEVSPSQYFKADDEFFTWTNLTPAAYQIGTPDGSGAANGYRLTPTGTGSCFNYLPFENGLDAPATFTWTLQFSPGGAASLLLGGTNDPAQCLAVRIDAGTRALEIRHAGTTVTSGTLAPADLSDDRAECVMRLSPGSGSGEVEIGSTRLSFNLAAATGPLRFWGYEVESAAVEASRPRWQAGTTGTGSIDLHQGPGIIDGTYHLPCTPGQSVTSQFSLDLDSWSDHPPGLLDTRATNSQGVVQGSWHLPKDSLLARQNERLFLRARIAP